MMSNTPESPAAPSSKPKLLVFGEEVTVEEIRQSPPFPLKQVEQRVASPSS